MTAGRCAVVFVWLKFTSSSVRFSPDEMRNGCRIKLS